MPRAYDRHPAQRTNADHNPIRNLLDWQSATAQSAQAAGQSINDAISVGSARAVGASPLGGGGALTQLWVNFQAYLNQVTGEVDTDIHQFLSYVEASAQSLPTLLNSWATTLTTPGQSWPDMFDSLESEWDTYVNTNDQLGTMEWASLTQIVDAIFGIDPTTGLTQQSQIAGLQDSWDQVAAAISGDVANAGPWAWVAQIVYDFQTILGIAHTTSVNNSNTLAIRTNKPLTYGLDDTTESNIPFAQSTTLIPVSSAHPMFTFVRCQQDDVKNTIAFVASLPASGAATQMYVNLWKVDFTNQWFTLIAQGATNLVSLLSTTPTWVFVDAAATAVDPGDVLMIEWNAGTGSGSFNLLGQSTTSGAPPHPNANLPGLAMTMPPSTTPPSAPGVTRFVFPALSSWNNLTIPYVGLETSSPPPPVYPDHVETFTSTRTFTTDAWASTIDIVGCGQGGGGQGETGSTVGRGGSPGAWGGQTLVVGVDIVAGGDITCTVQPRPSSRGTSEPGSGGSYFHDGRAGGATVFTWTKPDGSTGTKTCAGGAGGGLGNANNLTTYGQGPGDFTFNGRTYTGGGNVLVPTDGYVPGSSGPGGQPFQYGFNGGQGEGWIVERQ